MLRIIHRLSTGCQWRKLPSRFGPWQTVHKTSCGRSTEPGRGCSSTSRPSATPRATSTGTSTSTPHPSELTNTQPGTEGPAACAARGLKKVAQRSAHMRLRPFLEEAVRPVKLSAAPAVG